MQPRLCRENSGLQQGRFLTQVRLADGFEEFQHKKMIRVRTMPRHRGDHNNHDTHQRKWKDCEHACSPFLMLRLQCYAKVKAKYAVVVIMVTQDGFRNLNASKVHHGAITELVK